MDASRTPFQAAARPGRRIGHRVEVHGAIGSTNDRAAALLTAGGEGVAVVAEEQRAGRGRRGRTWTSPPGVNLLLSVGVRPAIDARRAGWLGMAAALAVHRAASSVVPSGGIGLKWPNDLVGDDDRKAGGLLVDTTLGGDRIAAAVVGIGINVNWAVADMPDAIRSTATSLTELAGAPVDRGALLAALLDALDEELHALEEGRSPRDRYRAACRTLGRDVVVEVGGRRVEGRATDIDADGALVLETSGGVTTVTAGEVVRVRGAVPA
jgi:BirA family transcriptional regulator, biotin operon repressor / biotin---[acetyl-CoA-carboxylase] ligase